MLLFPVWYTGIFIHPFGTLGGTWNVFVNAMWNLIVSVLGRSFPFLHCLTEQVDACVPQR